MARRTATFRVTINSLAGSRTVSVAVGTTVSKFKSDNGIATSSKVFDEAGELTNSSILVSDNVTIITAKKNG